MQVDDCTSGADDVETGKVFYAKTKSIMKEGGFELRKWTTNDKTLQEFFEEIQEKRRRFAVLKINPRFLSIKL